MSLTAMSLTLNCVTSIQRNRKREDQFLQLSSASHEYIIFYLRDTFLLCAVVLSKGTEIQACLSFH